MSGYETINVQDHEQWLKLAEKAEGGVFVMHGFMAFNSAAPPNSSRRLITDRNVVERAVGNLREEFGWGGLAQVISEMTTGEAIYEALPGGESRYLGEELRTIEGGWWIGVPVDYHECLHNPESCEFHVRANGRDVTLYARELAEKRAGNPSLGEFEYTVQAALVDGNMCLYNDDPEAPAAIERHHRG